MEKTAGIRKENKENAERHATQRGQNRTPFVIEHIIIPSHPSIPIHESGEGLYTLITIGHRL